MKRLLLIALAGCWSSSQPPPSHQVEVDGLAACPPARLEAFARRFAGAELTLAVDQIAGDARTVEVPCTRDEDDEACLARARAGHARDGVAIAGATISGSTSHVEFTYELAGQGTTTETAASMEAVAKRLLELRAQGRAVTPIAARSIHDPDSRIAEVALVTSRGRARRTGRIRWQAAGERAAALAEVQDAAEAADMVLIRFQSVEHPAGLVIDVTCDGP